MTCISESSPVPRILTQQEALDQCDEATCAVISFIDPGMEAPSFRLTPDAAHIVFAFHDIISPLGRCTMVSADDMRALVDFCRAVPEQDCGRVIIHCQQGISRSTAAALIMLASHGRVEDNSAFERLFEGRPVFWPNSAMLEQADELLGTGGRLAAAGLDFRRRTYVKRPDFVAELRSTHRRAEVDAVEALAATEAGETR